MRLTTGWSGATYVTASSSTSRPAFRPASKFALAALALAGAAPAQSPRPFDPVAFFTGSTRGEGMLKELLGKGKRVQTASVGHVEKDGLLVLDQKVAVEGDPIRQRQWRLRPTAPGKYRGTLSDAKGPVEIDVGQLVQIRYVMTNGIRVEQVLTPVPGGKALDNRSTFHKFGMKVATLTERIEKR
ncbi:MAG: DUF3833 family protein [Sphingomicrobium sp.]